MSRWSVTSHLMRIPELKASMNDFTRKRLEPLLQDNESLQIGMHKIIDNLAFYNGVHNRLSEPDSKQIFRLTEKEIKAEAFPVLLKLVDSLNELLNCIPNEIEETKACHRKVVEGVETALQVFSVSLKPAYDKWRDFNISIQEKLEAVNKLEFAQLDWNGLQIFEAQHKNQRHKQLEDFSCKKVLAVRDEKVLMLGVFDGHGGTICADIAAKDLWKYIQTRIWFLEQECKDMTNQELLQRALEEGFVDYDSNYLFGTSNTIRKAGSTAVVCVLSRKTKEMWTCNVGDSELWLSHEEQTGESCTPYVDKAASAYEAESSNLEAYTELRRVVLGGHNVQRNWMGIRLDGGVMLTRSFGDALYKGMENDTDEYPVFPSLWSMSAYPHVNYRRLLDKNDYFVMASDGLYDVFHNPLRYIKEELKKDKAPPDAKTDIKTDLNLDGATNKVGSNVEGVENVKVPEEQKHGDKQSADKQLVREHPLKQITLDIAKTASRSSDDDITVFVVAL